ncbi:metallophosphoesterase, partial [Streptomyces sp. MBT98]|nr:metallophosphoesterase [Streptomyces sp. MBT98]
MVFALVGLVVLALLGAVHRYVWRRFVGDTTAPGSRLRRAGTVAAFVLPLLSVGAMTSGRVGAPFWLQQVLAWPGFLWLACLLYLTLALLVGEVVRPVLLRVLARRDAARTGAENGTASGTPAETSGTPTEVPDEPRPRTEKLVTSGSTGVSAPPEAVARTASDAPDPVAEPETEPAATASAPAGTTPAS